MDIGTLIRSAVQPAAGTAAGVAVSVEGADPLTFRELQERITRYAQGFLRLGCQPGDRIGLLLYNSVEYWAAYFAVVRLGAVAVRLNFRLSAQELQYALADSGASILCTNGDLIDLVESIRPELTIAAFVHHAETTPTPTWCHDWSELDNAPAQEPTLPLPQAETPAMLMYTSGTTGRPKGALWTHGNTSWIAAMQAIKWGLNQSTVSLTTGPMYHVGAFEDLLLPTLLCGGETIVCRSKGFDIGRIMDVMAKRGVTDAFLYPFMIHDLLRHPALPTTDLSRLRRIVTGGSALATWAVHSMAELLPQVQLTSAYGLTEGGAMTTVLDPSDAQTNPDAVGRPLPATEVRVVDDDGNDVPPGVDGEVWVRSPSVCMGYWNQPTATADTFVDGWCRTGDLGQLTAKDALLKITGRKKDMIKTGGENVYPAEIERILNDHSDIAECAVIGVPDLRLQEAVCAVVVRSPKSDLSTEDVMTYASSHLARYKSPRHVVFVDVLPRNSAGKVLKEVLREDHRKQSPSLEADDRSAVTGPQTGPTGGPGQ